MDGVSSTYPNKPIFSTKLVSMKTIYQQDTNGCWIACASMLSGVPYSDIKAQFKFQGEVTGRSAKPLVDHLSDLGVKCDHKSTKISDAGGLKELKFDALVYFKNVDEDGDEAGGHWMVWDHKEQVIRDPEGWQAGTTFRIKNYRKVKPIK